MFKIILSILLLVSTLSAVEGFVKPVGAMELVDVAKLNAKNSIYINAAIERLIKENEELKNKLSSSDFRTSKNKENSKKIVLDDVTIGVQ